MKALRIVNYRVMRTLGADWETCTVDGFTVRYSLRDHFIGSALYFDREWEPHVGKVIRAMNLDGAAVIDVGAHVGIHTLQLARAVGVSGRVIALEPEERNAAMLRRNVATNGFTNVDIVPAAASDACGSALLAIDDFNRGGHRLHLRERETNGRMRDVRTTTVDAITSALPDDSVRFVKIDAEASELAVLRGMERTLALNPSLVLLVEVSADANPGVTVDFLRERGFEGWEVQRNRAIPLQPAGVYEQLVADHVEVVVSRDRRAVDDLVRRAYARR